MLGLMQSQPLLISGLINHAERHHGDAEIVSRRVEGDLHRSTWAGVACRSRAPQKQGISVRTAFSRLHPGATIPEVYAPAFNGTYRRAALVDFLSQRKSVLEVSTFGVDRGEIKTSSALTFAKFCEGLHNGVILSALRLHS